MLVYFDFIRPILFTHIQILPLTSWTISEVKDILWSHRFTFIPVLTSFVNLLVHQRSFIALNLHPANFTDSQKHIKKGLSSNNRQWHRVHSLSALAGGNNCYIHVYQRDQRIPRHWRKEDDTGDTPNLSLKPKMELLWLSGTSWSWHYSHIPVPVPYDHPKLPRYNVIDLPSENGSSPWTSPLLPDCLSPWFPLSFSQYFPTLWMITSTMTRD